MFVFRKRYEDVVNQLRLERQSNEEMRKRLGDIELKRERTEAAARGVVHAVNRPLGWEKTKVSVKRLELVLEQC